MIFQDWTIIVKKSLEEKGGRKYTHNHCKGFFFSVYAAAVILAQIGAGIVNLPQPHGVFRNRNMMQPLCEQNRTLCIMVNSQFRVITYFLNDSPIVSEEAGPMLHPALIYLRRAGSYKKGVGSSRMVVVVHGGSYIQSH